MCVGEGAKSRLAGQFVRVFPLSRPFIQFSVGLACTAAVNRALSLWTLRTTIPFHSILRNTIIILAHEARVM